MNDSQSTTPLLQIFAKLLEGSYGLSLQIVSIILFLLFFNFLVKVGLTKLKKRFLRQNKVWYTGFVCAIEKPLNYFVWFTAFICALDATLNRFLHHNLFNVHTILNLGIVLAIGWFLLRWNSKVLQDMLTMSRDHRIDIPPAKLDLISKLATIVIIILTVFLAMDVTGRDMQTVIAFGGIGGLALAFASQQAIANFFGGVMVYLTQPFSIGELINLPDKKIEGHVEEIGWYMTRIRNLDKKPIYVPNSIFTQTIVITPSRMSHERFFHTINLRYHDIDVIKQTVTDIKLMLLKHPQIDHKQKVEVYFLGFGDTALNINISAYIHLGQTDFPSIKQDILLKIADLIRSQGASFATSPPVIQLASGAQVIPNVEHSQKSILN
jgi:MscS family membrane protein